MSIYDDLIAEVDDIFEGDHVFANANDIPTVEQIGLGSVGKELEMAMQFIDIHEATKIVDGFRRQTAAKMYKAFLKGVVRYVNGRDGLVLSFNGDGVLAGFAGRSKCTNASQSALGLSWYIEQYLRPKMQAYFERNSELNDMAFDYGLGIDVGEITVVRAGIRGVENNDLVWVGNATNMSVKLSELGSWPFNLWISEAVFSRIRQEHKTSSDNRPMWESRTWTGLEGRTVYRSNWMVAI
jgi:class 3 adenylate cyclase